MEESEDALAIIGRQCPLGVHLVRQFPESKRRRQLEAFIRARYAHYYGARIVHFMPCLMGFEDAEGNAQAAAGLRAATPTVNLFLERYLNAPVEEVLGAEIGAVVERREIIEVGNFASFGPGGARMLIAALTDLLSGLGYHWVAFTGTPMLLNSFQRLGLPLIFLGEADPACMGAELVDWGSYYDTRPQVAATSVAACHQRLLAAGVYRLLGYQPLHREVPHAHCG
ncbi:thermostable hemolysin [Azotobacter bryophylli]|uniref:Thermostable hemolysin n=1 Tax=Azotobacter bryophylli TaxID=1986537 RepID=A0ABV7AZF8_9GAMM